MDKNKLLVRGRHFVREGPLVKVCRREDKIFFFWLFTDLLVYGHSVGGGRYKFHRSMDILDVRVSSPDVHEHSQNPCFTISSKNKSFVVYVHGKPSSDSFRAPREPLGEVGDGSIEGFGMVNERPPETKFELRDAWFRDLYELTSAHMLNDGPEARRARGKSN